ncbi:MAG: glycosyltransferase [Acidobacteria bacterium]|nr:glycosyltransferase [Acidobacteriota bacterium]
MRVLITNNRLAQRTGSELYVWDLATRLLDRGHTPVVYSPELGPLAMVLRERTVPVTEDLRTISTRPDIIHGQQTHEMMTALLHFPAVPGIRFCHGWVDEPVLEFPRILRYVAVDETTRDRLLFEWGIPENKIEVVLNFADLIKFKAGDPLPQRPRRALVFSNYGRQYLWAVREACAQMNITVDAVGGTAAVAQPESLLGKYDLVFARGRSAIESLAMGRAVVLCDSAGVGPMVTSAEFDRLRVLNFGCRTFREPLSPQAILHELSRYDPTDAAEVSRRIRAAAGADVAVETIIGLYQCVISEHLNQARLGVEPEFRAVSLYLKSLEGRLKTAQGAKAALYVFLRSLYRCCGRLPGLRLLARSKRAMLLARYIKWRLLRITGLPS